MIKSQLSPYFDIMLPALTIFCDNYSIRLPTFCLPVIKHAFVEQRLDYQLIKNCNAIGSQDVILKAQALFFYGFKTFVNFGIIDMYADGCYDASCVTCHIIAQQHNLEEY